LHRSLPVAAARRPIGQERDQDPFRLEVASVRGFPEMLTRKRKIARYSTALKVGESYVEIGDGVTQPDRTPLARS
jgi:hypothetical protein